MIVIPLFSSIPLYPLSAEAVQLIHCSNTPGTKTVQCVQVFLSALIDYKKKFCPNEIRNKSLSLKCLPYIDLALSTYVPNKLELLAVSI